VEEDRLLTKEEAAKYLHVSRSTINRFMKEIPYIKLGKGRKGRVLFRKSDIDAFLESHKIQKK